MQNERERLKRVIEKILDEGFSKHIPLTSDFLADNLIANGVRLLPCKVGDRVYVISRYYTGNWQIYNCKVDSFTIYESNVFFDTIFSKEISFGLNTIEIGKTVFLTREAAEESLRKEQKK